ncbi:MAG: hypothetical protein A2284_09250 [Deltaproteobacteria bacterium RIFOXYA12_FULL_61_11]|nr:MAG: hypothetical protein A2284_09250 [Deltaproteobacteria bacterium RIFOXYA12_FULL_61_11]
MFPSREELHLIAFLLGAFVLGGIAQTLWFRSPSCRLFAYPLDGGRTLRGRRIFGDNKTVAGFLVFVPVVSGSFALLGWLTELQGLDFLSRVGWPEQPLSLFFIGLAGSFGYMLAELPNSMIKRQFSVEPGARPTGWLRYVTFAMDQGDSVLGALLLLHLAAPLPRTTWFSLLVLAAVVHWLFNVVLYLLGVKSKPC